MINLITFLIILLINPIGAGATEAPKTLVTIQGNKLLVEEVVKVADMSKNGLGMMWKPVFKSEKFRVLSVFLNNKWLVPFRKEKDNQVVIGDLNKEKTNEELFVNVKYLIKTGRDNNVLQINNPEQKEILIKNIDRLEFLACENSSSNLLKDSGQEMIISCKSEINVRTKSWWKQIFRL